MWRHIIESHSTSYIRWFARLVFPRISVFDYTDCPCFEIQDGEDLLLDLKMQTSGLKTSAWWSRGSHFVENGYPSLRFPNMVKVNIHEHWTRVTRFNPLWVSARAQPTFEMTPGFKPFTLFLSRLWRFLFCFYRQAQRVSNFISYQPLTKWIY